MKIKDMIGKEVKIYPNDTYSKSGLILEMNDNGVLFEITQADRQSGYTPGEIVFISFSARLTFKYKQ